MLPIFKGCMVEKGKERMLRVGLVLPLLRHGKRSSSSPLWVYCSNAYGWQSAPRFRSFSTLSRQPPTVALLKALRKEIHNAENTHTAASFEDKKKVPPPFTISDKPGEQEVYLHRTYGDEDISIACFFQTESFTVEECDDQQKGEDSDNQTLHFVQMVINIKKVGGDNPYLELICRSYGDEPVIQSVIYKQNDLSPEELPYEGPNFLDLDKNLKVGFVRYLLIRGIDARLGDFMLQYMYNKKHLEHLRWLRNVESFFKESDV